MTCRTSFIRIFVPHIAPKSTEREKMHGSKLSSTFYASGSQITAEKYCKFSKQTYQVPHIASKSTKTEKMEASKLTQALLPPRQPPPKSYAREELILLSSFVCGIFLKLHPVPSFIFKAVPLKIFHAFVVSIIFAFTGAFSSLLTRGKVEHAKYERFSGFYSMVSMLFAIAILVYAVSLSCFI